jgi:hypothetical protein
LLDLVGQRIVYRLPGGWRLRVTAGNTREDGEPLDSGVIRGTIVLLA